MSKQIVLSLTATVMLSSPFLFPLLFPLAWVAFVPLFWAVEKVESIKWATFYGWLTGLFAHLFGFYWLVYTISVFGGFSYPVSSVVFIVYAALQGLQIAVFTLLVRWLGFGPLSVLPAVFWVALEFWFPRLFPWYLANSQHLFNSFIQTADVVGPYGASFIIMWANAALYTAIVSYNKKQQVRWQPAVPVLVLVVFSVIYGVLRLKTLSNAIASAPKLSVAAVQGNIDVDLKWDPKRARENLEVYRTLTKRTGGVSVVTWPETSVEEWVPESLDKLPRDYMPALNSATSYFIFGAKSFEGSPGTRTFKAFNTAFLTDSNGTILDRYHKQVLLAFGEYIPFTAVLAKLPGIPFSDSFTPGKGPHTFDIGGHRLGPLICYEDLMPALSRAFVNEAKATILINLTNDAWYGKTVAPWQHARLARWRAIETRRSLLRTTNTGVTVLINAKGEVGEALPIFTPSVLVANAEVLDGSTFYVRFGDWFAWTATLVSIGVIIFFARRPG